MTEIIVEAASNHGGQRAWQDRFIEDAAAVGADMIKFQSYQTRHLSPADPQYDWMRHAELSDADHEHLLTMCAKHGIRFLTTVYTADRVPFIAGLGLRAIKIGSGEGGNAALLHAIAEHPWKVYLSTGLMTLPELDRANIILAHREVVLLHTVSRYPTPIEAANLGRIAWLENHTCRPAGYSDHTVGIAAPMMAVAMGAACVEVHYAPVESPRCQAWDKSKAQLGQLVVFALQAQAAKTPHPMVWPVGEERPYVGRWQHEA